MFVTRFLEMDPVSSIIRHFKLNKVTTLASTKLFNRESENFRDSYLIWLNSGYELGFRNRPNRIQLQLQDGPTFHISYDLDLMSLCRQLCLHSAVSRPNENRPHPNLPSLEALRLAIGSSLKWLGCWVFLWDAGD